MNPLSTQAILQRMADALPTHEAGDEASDLASSYEAIALLVHAYLSALDFRLCGFNEDQVSPDCESLSPRLPRRWNAGFGSLTLAYKHKQSSMRFVFRVDRMGTKTEIRGLAVGDENILRFECVTRDIVDARQLPVRIPLRDGAEDRSALPEKLRSVFTSQQAIEDILHNLKVNIVQKLFPGLIKEGYVESHPAPNQPPIADNVAPPGVFPPFVPHPPPAPLAVFPPPSRPVPDFVPPGFEDEHQMMPHHRPPFNIGYDDLNPPALGPFGPLAGPFARPHPPGGFGGMHPTFDDPLFTGQGRRPSNPQIPPGARWDPTGPGGHPRFPGQGGQGNGGFPPFGGGGNTFF